jgi:hypothetical protein
MKLNRTALALAVAGAAALTPTAASQAEVIVPPYCPPYETWGNDVVNAAGDAGCVVVGNDASGLWLKQVILAPGWSYTVNSSDRSRVRLQFTNGKQKVDFRVEPGRTYIK